MRFKGEMAKWVGIPCLSNIIIWSVILTHPSLALNAGLLYVFFLLLIPGFTAATLAGLVLLNVAHSFTEWCLVAISIGVLVLNIYGVFWVVGLRSP